MEYYKIIQALSASELQRLVNIEISNGYTPIGSMVMLGTEPPPSTAIYYQPVYLEPTPSEAD